MFDLNLSQLIVPGTEATDLLQCLVKVNGQPLPDIAIPHEVKIDVYKRQGLCSTPARLSK